MLNFLSSGRPKWLYAITLLAGIAIGFALGNGAPSRSTTSGACAENSSISSVSSSSPESEVLGKPVFRHPGVIESSADGLILVRWLPVKGAKTYNIRIWNDADKEVKNYDIDRNYTYIKHLDVDLKRKQTPYFVVVTPLGDTPDIRGKESERKEVAVIPLRNLQPPTIKSIQTEAEEPPK